MQTRFSILILLVGLTALAACDTAGPDRTGIRVDALSHNADALIGTWDLVSFTSSGQAGPPETTPYRGIRQGYTFRADGMAEVRDYSGATRLEAYVIVPAGPSYPDAPPSLRIGDRSESWGIDGDRLYLDDRPLDGGLYEYVRQ